MKRSKLVVITTLAVSLATSMIVTQPTATEARSSILPTATPSPIKRKVIRKTKNLGDTGTHEVGHKSRRKSGNSVRSAKPTASIMQDYYAHGNLKKPAGKVSSSRLKKPRVVGVHNDGEIYAGVRSPRKSKNEVSIESIERRKQPRRKRKN